MTVRARLVLRRDGFVLDAELEVPATGVTALFGPSGCGKTTLLRALAGLEKCAGGEVRVESAVWQSGAHFVPVHRRGVGFVFQESSLFPHLTVRGNLEYGLKRTPAERRRTTVDQAAGLLGVGHLLARRPAGLSGGERQRVALARALVTGPRLLLMDEPLASLDAGAKAEILPYLRRVPAELGIPALVVSHDLTEVVSLADHLVLMAQGRVLAAGPLNRMLTDPELPLASDPEASAVLAVRVLRQDTAYGLTDLEFSGGVVTVPHLDLPVGAPARLRVRARDVSLTLERQTGTSILNALPARVAALKAAGTAQVVVVLEAGEARLLARITSKSADALQLAPGRAVHAQIKSLAIL